MDNIGAKDKFIELWTNVRSLYERNAQYLNEADSEYIDDWLSAIYEAHEMGFFDVPESVRKELKWNEYNFIRYDWGNALVGFRSEMVALLHNIKYNVTPSVCSLTPEDKRLQLSGVDFIQHYIGNKNYKVYIQVKTSNFDKKTQFISINRDWLQYTPIGRFHRISIVDINLRAILKADFSDFQNSSYEIENGNWILDVRRVTNCIRFGHKYNTVSSIDL